jgi:hypothetical protein
MFIITPPNTIIYNTTVEKNGRKGRIGEEKPFFIRVVNRGGKIH